MPPKSKPRSKSQGTNSRLLVRNGTARRLAYRAGVYRMSSDIFTKLNGALASFGDVLMGVTAAVASGTGRETIQSKDVRTALKLTGMDALGGEHFKPRRRKRQENQNERKPQAAKKKNKERS